EISSAHLLQIAGAERIALTNDPHHGNVVTKHWLARSAAEDAVNTGPLHEIGRAGEPGLIAGSVEADVGHAELIGVAKHEGAVDELLIEITGDSGAAEYQPIQLERRFQHVRHGDIASGGMNGGCECA